MHGQNVHSNHSSPHNRLSGLHRSHSHPAVPPVAQRSVWKRSVSFVVAGGLSLAALGATVRPWERLGASLSTETAAAVHPARTVTVVAPQREAAGTVVLPATVQPWQSARLYGRVSGYVKSWSVEMGQSVEAGEVLAEIDTPELDQELAQAEADLQAARVAVAQAEAELAEGEAILNEAEAEAVRSEAELSLADKQLQRREQLVARQALTREDLDLAIRDQKARTAEVSAAEASVKRQTANLETRRAIVESRKAMVHSREAIVRRLTQLQAFKRIEAPFAGVITRRNAEIGSLVTAGSSSGAPLFDMVQLDRVRVQVAVPQTEAQGIAVGTAVTILVPEAPGLSHSGTVTRTSESLDSATRTLLVETELSNADGRLKPGLYTQARLATASGSDHWLIPNSALRMQVDGPHVVLADPHGRLTIRPIELGRDHGTLVTVLSGFNGTEQLVVNPTDDLHDGMSIQVQRASSRR